ncbi:hypothetical protein H1R20_g13357, partial [Candolleomyces eurysporus]
MAEDTDHGDNPFVVSLKPPVNETPTERATREAREAEAKKRSDEIDLELRTERTRRNELKAVFIGDSESGRLDMVNHLRMRFAQEEWNAELAKCKSVILLKIFEAVVAILDALRSELDGEALVESPLDDAHSNVATEYPFDMPSCSDAAPSGRLESSSPGTSNGGDIPAGDDSSILTQTLTVMLERRVKKRPTEKEEDRIRGLLEDLNRIASRGYVPSNEDVAHVRSRIGIQEYRIKLDGAMIIGRTPGEDMCLYDIASWRTARPTWMPYFEGVDTVVFFASISGFDERLLEDPSVNRLENSLLLWREVCRSWLLSESGLVLFLTKCDSLQRKLVRGVKVKNYLPSYGDRSNDSGTVLKYVRDKFRDIAKDDVRKGGSLHIHSVSTVDLKAVTIFISTVKDIILRKNLKHAPLV